MDEFYSEYIFIKYLNSGFNGIISLYENKKNQKLVVLKKQQVPSDINDFTDSYIYHEYLFYNILNNKKFLKIKYQWFEKNNNLDEISYLKKTEILNEYSREVFNKIRKSNIFLCTVTNYAGETLGTYFNEIYIEIQDNKLPIKTKNISVLSEWVEKLYEDLLIIFNQLRTFNFIHSDIHINNICWNKENGFVLIDYGDVKLMDKIDNYRSISQCTLGFYDEEFIRSIKNAYEIKSDLIDIILIMMGHDPLIIKINEYYNFPFNTILFLNISKSRYFKYIIEKISKIFHYKLDLNKNLDIIFNEILIYKYANIYNTTIFYNKFLEYMNIFWNILDPIEHKNFYIQYNIKLINNIFLVDKEKILGLIENYF